jgi:protein-S-isoprenylcysteine O-methyltransferase Ste14
MVILQFTMLGLLFFTGPVITHRWYAILLMFIGGLVGLWAIWTITLGNLSIMPYVKEGGKMVAKGPYRFIRHPMYTGLILVGWGLVLGYYTPLRLVFVLILTLALVIKLHLEETYLKKAFQPYSEYTRQTKKLIPFIW